MAVGRRSTVYNGNLTTEDDWRRVNTINKKLLSGFIGYCKSNDRSHNTIHQYEEQLKIFFIWNLNENSNKTFTDIKKREFVNFFGYGRIDLQWSSSRLASFRAVLSSLSNYIELILDDEYPMFRNVIKILEPITVEPVREKTVITEELKNKTFDVLLQEENYQEACWFALMLCSGMRKAEAVQMKVEYFTPDRLKYDIMYVTDKIRTKGRGKNGKQVSRYIFKEDFQRYFDMWMQEREQKGIKSEWLFVVKHNGEYEPAKITTLNSWARRVSDIMGVDFYNHSCRHYWTTTLKTSGYPDSVIQLLQNWANADMVEVYNDTSQEEELAKFFNKTSK